MSIPSAMPGPALAGRRQALVWRLRLRRVLRKVAAILGTLLASSFLIFLSLDLAPGNPVTLLSGGRALSPAAIARLTSEYHLNDSLPLRYWYWLTGVIHGNFGQSTLYREPVSTLLAPRLATTAFLVAYSSILIVAFGIGLGLISGLGRRGTRTTITVGTAIGMGIPSFVAAILLTTVFSVQLGWFPVFGAGAGFASRLWHLTLPAIALALFNVAYVTRIAGVAVAEESAQEHVTTATVRGIPRRAVIRRHVLRNAMLPIITVSGLTIASMFALTAVVEQAFQLNGIGALLISSVNVQDFPVVQAITLIIVVAFVLTNTIVDALYHRLDPRVRSLD